MRYKIENPDCLSISVWCRLGEKCLFTTLPCYPYFQVYMLCSASEDASLAWNNSGRAYSSWRNSQFSHWGCEQLSKWWISPVNKGFNRGVSEQERGRSKPSVWLVGEWMNAETDFPKLAFWFTPIILALGRHNQENWHKFKASLIYIAFPGESGLTSDTFS